MDKLGKLAQLKSVQEVDREIYSLNRRLAAIPKEIEALKAKFESEKSALKSHEQDLKNFQVKQKEKEGQLASKEESLKKFDGQLNLVKTNKEYAALKSEMNNIKADNSILEEEILKFMEEGEVYKQRIAEEKKRLAIIEGENASYEKTLLEEKKKIEAEAAELKAKKQNLVQGVDGEILSLYERILLKKDGIALVPALNGACGGCSMQLRPQLVDQLHMKDRIVVCENCARILFIETPVTSS